jgi:hypothetical protein
MRVIMGLVLLCLAACAPPSGGGGATQSPSTSSGSPGTGSTTQADNDLQIEIDRGDGKGPERYTLSCLGSASGSHPDPQAACAHLASLPDPFAPIPTDAVCTELYGGPQTAHITGVWGGKPVDLELSRTDGCRISQWDRLGPLLPGPVGVAPPS